MNMNNSLAPYSWIQLTHGRLLMIIHEWWVTQRESLAQCKHGLLLVGQRYVWCGKRESNRDPRNVQPVGDAPCGAWPGSISDATGSWYRKNQHDIASSIDVTLGVRKIIAVIPHTMFDITAMKIMISLLGTQCIRVSVYPCIRVSVYRERREPHC